MAVCKTCGKRFGFLQGADGSCSDCRLRSVREQQLATALPECKDALEQNAQPIAERSDEPKIEDDANSVILTTEAVTDLKILRRIEIVTAECAFGMHLFKDLFAGIRDIVGGRSAAVESTMRDARRTVLIELKKETRRVGADACIGVTLSYVELGGRGSNMVLLVASGTAVELDKQS